nr:site-specific integrase [uncultured Blautia sp.]
MRQKSYKKPQINETFFYGNILSYKSIGDVIYIKARNKYCYRLVLIFESGDIRTVQAGGFTNKQKARAAKEQAIVQISKGNFVPYSYTVKEFYDYWLYHYMIEEKQITYNTFTAYKSILNNHLLPVLRHKKLSGLQRKDLLRALGRISSQNVQRTAAGVISGSLRLAQARGYISTNIYQGIAAEVKRKNLQKKRQKGTSVSKTQVYTVKQAAYILYMCKQTEPQLYLPMLLAVTAGLRLSEIIAVKYEDIDFQNKKLSVKRQLGRRLQPVLLFSGQSYPVTSDEIPLKTSNSKRIVALADFVIDEILLERQKYEKRRAESSAFLDLGYICCRENGQCYQRGFYTKAYSRVMEKCEFQRLPWRKFRNTYATILSEYKVHIKTISQCLGHYSPVFTSKVYVEDRGSVYDISHVVESYITKHKLFPQKNEEQDSQTVYELPGDSAYNSFF